MKKNNPYGYKLGYRENGSLSFTRYFMTYTYKQARRALSYYRKYQQHERETNRPIVNPFWEIKPITEKEYAAGIWDEIPFRRRCHFYRLSLKITISLKRRKNYE